MYDKNTFRDKIVLVTGGRSGIGYGIASQFLDLGAKLMICSRKEEALKEASEKLSLKGECHYHPCDIRNVEQINELMTKIKTTYGRLDILINNAGGQFPAPSELISENGWNAVIANNLNGTFYMSQASHKSFFKSQNSGVIVNIIANTFRGFPGMAHTGAARAAVENLTKTLAQEWSYENVRVNCIAPGTIRSSGLDKYPEPVKEYFQNVEEGNLMKRLGTTEDVANAVMFLSSDLSSYVSGTTLYVDGMEHLAGDRMGFYNVLKKMTNI